MKHLVLPASAPLIPLVADMLLEMHADGRDLADTACVFPGKRPALYLRRELARRLQGPFHPPAIFDVDGFMSFLARLTRQGRGREETDLVTRLSHAFGASRDTGDAGLPERFEDFFFWGLRLLDVFDEFGTELVELDAVGKAVRLALLDGGLSSEARGIWKALPGLFEAWRDRLAGHRIGTRGEDYRIAASAIDALDLPFRQCLLAGFSALTRAEERVFASLARRGIARAVIQEEENDPLSGRIQGAIPGAWERVAGEPPRSSPRIRIFRGADLHAEIELAHAALEEAPPDPEETAIVLPDPGALVPVLTWLVEGLGVPFNVSMGYPLDRTPVAGLLMKALDAVESREEGVYHVPDYLAFLKHPFITSLTPADCPDPGGLRSLVHAVSDRCAERRLIYARLSEIEHFHDMDMPEGVTPGHLKLLARIHQMGLSKIEAAQTVQDFAASLAGFLRWTAKSGPSASHPFGREAMEAVLGLLDGTADSPLGPEPMTTSGFRRLLAHLFRTTPIPFRGSPLAGIQVLGFLETRSLRFRHVLVFDATEGVLPGERQPDPVLPDGLRRALGLPSRETAVGIFRHHFRCLVAGAEKALLLSSGRDGAEPSRFVQEIIWEEEKRRRVVDALPVEGLSERHRVPLPEYRRRKKTWEVLSFLRGYTFSPSALDTYLQCPFRFYARFVLGLGEPRSAARAEIDPLVTGEIVHAALEDFYKPFLGGLIGPRDSWKTELEAACDRALGERFADPASWSGAVRLFREILLYRLGNFVCLDLETASGRRLVALEEEAAARLSLPGGWSARIAGRIDRVELDPDGTLWVIDYKTGRSTAPASLPLEPVAGRKEILKAFGSLQLPVYLLLWRERKDVEFRAMNAAIRGLRAAGGGNGREAKETPKPLIPPESPWEEAFDGIFIPAVRSVLEEILDPNVPFEEDPSDPAACRNCPYSRGLCRAAC